MASVACYQVEDVVVSYDVQIGNILGVNTSLVLMDFEEFITAYNGFYLFHHEFLYILTQPRPTLSNP